MFVKILLLVTFSAILAIHLGKTVEELQKYLEDADATIKAREHEAQIDIRDASMPLKVYCQEAQSYIIGNLTQAAQPYWQEVAKLKEQAASKGQDISDCIELGNKQLFALNDTTVLPPISQITYYLYEGNQLLINNSLVAYNQVMVFIDFRIKAANCSDDGCATELYSEASALFQEASNIIYNSVEDSLNYVDRYLKEVLSDITIDTDKYVKSYGQFLDDIKSCIDGKQYFVVN